MNLIRIGLVLVLGALTTMPIQAAIIGPTNDWLSLSEGAAKFGLSQETVDMLLDAGGELSCVYTIENGKRAQHYLNGWITSNWPGKVLTNGHFLFDGGNNRYPPEKMANCMFKSNRVVQNEEWPGGLPIEADSTLYRAGGTDLTGPDRPYEDRMLVPLRDEAAPESMLQLSPQAEGFEMLRTVYLVSAARAFHSKTSKGLFEPMIQKCAVRTLYQGAIPLLTTDCDVKHGVSAAMLFVEDDAMPGQLRPVALLTKMHEYSDPQTGEPLDNRPYSAEYNSSQSILMTEAFFTFDVVPDQAVH